MIDRGYMIVAQNNKTVDYLQCARVLARSIMATDPNARITLLSDVVTDDPVYEYSLTFPYGDMCIDSEWKLANDWQVYGASPYEQTIKLEADMYVPRSINHWWDVLKHRDLHICTTIRNYHGIVSNVRDYRTTIDNNNLPDTYNAITLFKRSNLAQQFFDIVRDIFQNWSHYTNVIITQRNEQPTTDIVYALAAHIVGREHCTVPHWQHISMTHMKQAINGNRMRDWTKNFVTEIHPHTLRINTYPQLFPVHYHVKEFATILERELQ